MKYQIIRIMDGKLITTETTDILAWAEVAGFTFAGFANSPRLHAELQGQPRFKELCGPMRGGDDAVRYEDWRANEIFST